MSLLLTGGRDHALLALVIQEAREVANSHGGPVGRRAVQLATYFLKGVGVPMGYRFDIYQGRPYCDEISRDIEWFIADEVLEDRSEPSAGSSDYAPAKALPELLSMHKKSMEPLRPRIRRVVGALVPLSPQRLELLSALDYAYRYKKASGGRGPWKDAVISRFREFTGDQFPPHEVSQAYGALVQTGLLEP